MMMYAYKPCDSRVSFRVIHMWLEKERGWLGTSSFRSFGQGCFLTIAMASKERSCRTQSLGE